MQKSKAIALSIIGVLLCFIFNQPVFAQQKKEISGTVTDLKGEPLIGVSVTLKEISGVGAITDLDGKYQLSVPANGKTLVAAYIGMKTKEMPIKGTTVNFTLEENSSELDEVVVIGYGSVKKRDLTGPVGSVTGDVLTKAPVSNAAEALTGRLAGVQITTSDGSPDAKMIIRVRGGGSVTGDNSPLYIVDGFPVSSINDVSTSDIQTIDVLKDASSTAIYGSQGANGVVIITTKSAQGGKTVISYNGYLQAKKLSKRMKVLDPYEFVMFNYEAAAFDGEKGISDFEKKYGVWGDLDLYKYQKGIDWQDDLFGANVLSYQHNLSINGGSDKTKFGLSATWNKNGGLMPSNDYERINVNFKLNHQISKTLRFSANARIIDSETNGNGTAGGSYKVRTSDAVTKPATKGVDGFRIVDPGTMTDDEYQQWLKSNVSLSEQAQWYWKRKNERTFNFTGSVDWDIFKWLSYRFEAGYEYGFNEQKNWWGQYTTNASYVGGLPLADRDKTNRNVLRMANTLTWNKKFGDHSVNVMAGQEIISRQSNNNYMYGTRFSKELSPEKVFANMGLSAGSTTITSYVSPDDNLASFFGRVGYNYLEKYLLTMTLRADGSSKFPAGNRWGTFPSVAVAWRMLEEPFMQKTKDYLSNLKLRFSYGQAGNNRISSTLYQLDYGIKTQKTYGLGDVANNYYAATNSQMPNPNLKWETTITRNLGLDIGLWDERLTLTAEAYWNTAKDLLIERNIVAPGYKTMVENTAQTSNKGFEMTLNANIINKKDFFLSANFNIGFNKSNVDKIANGLSMQEYASGWAGTDLKGMNDYRIIVGKPVGQIYGWVTDGYYTTNDFSRYDEATNKYILKDGVAETRQLGGKIGVRPGTIKLKDLNGDNVVDDKDRTVIGNTNPDFTGGFGFNGGWKGIDFTVMFNFVYGNDIYNANKIIGAQQYRTGTYQANLLSFMDGGNRYTYLDRSSGRLVTDLATLAEMNEGSNAKEYWSPLSFGNSTVMPHSWAIEDASFLRLQNVTVGYTFPKKMTRKFMCDQVRLYCTLNNLWVWTSYSGYDPEVSSPVRGSSTSGLTPGVDYSAYPKSFSYTFGVNLTF